MKSIFHLAINVTDLNQTRWFYRDVLGCAEGRSTSTWVDFDFFGHQLSCHLGQPFPTQPTGHVDGIKVPMPHLGAVLQLADWQEVVDRLAREDAIEYVFKPMLRYEGQTGEQWTVFFLDPAGNPIELKGFADLNQVYAS